MPRNTGKSTEAEFEAIWAKLGKHAWCFRLADKAEIFGRNGRHGNVRPQPSDYIVVHDGQTEFAEVKSTHDPRAFRFSLLSPKQAAMAARVYLAGGLYSVYIQVLPAGIWYRLSYRVIEQYRMARKASIPWADMEVFKW